jgi:hypothetical protein
MTIFTNRFAWEFTPLTDMIDEVETTPDVVETAWSALRTASKAGDSSLISCDHNGNGTNNFANPVGGCWPNMPREYLDEPGTDHTTGLQQALDMFVGSGNVDAYRAAIVLTDGIPNGVGSCGTTRGAQGYVEGRWTEYALDCATQVPHTTVEIVAESPLLAQQMNTQEGVNVWAISFVQDLPSPMSAQDGSGLAQGDGYYVRTSDPAQLITLFEEIADGLPIAVVR